MAWGAIYSRGGPNQQGHCAGRLKYHSRRSLYSDSVTSPFACQPKGVIFTDQRMGIAKMVVEIIGHTKVPKAGWFVGLIVQPPAGQRFKVMDDWRGGRGIALRKAITVSGAAELV